MLPNRVFGTAIVLRSLLMWVGVRSVSVGLGTPLTLGPHTVLVMMLVLAMTSVDRAIHRERVFLSNVGVAPGTLRTMSLIPAVIAELTIHMAFV